MIIENFKSYSGRVQVGPFRKFSCIIGPNGAGKSNLMDALSFVLGVQARHLRSERLHDLIYRREEEDPRSNQRTASVELVYVGGDSPYTDGHVSEHDGTLSFKRLVLRTGEARFLLNNVAVSQADYQSKLEGINILYKVRNFLVFQGDVEATAQRQGKDLTAFFEHISGSDAFRQEYERLGAEKAKKEDQARFLFTKKRNAINEKKRVSQQKAEADEYQQLEGERVNLQREFYLFRLHGVERQISDVSSKRAVVAEERAGVKADLKRGAETSDGVDRRRAQEHLAANQAWRAVGTIRTKVEKATTEHTAASSRLAFLRQRIELIEATEEKDTRRQSQLEEQVIALEAQRADISHESRKLAARVAQHEVRFTAQQRTEFDSAQRESERITATRSDRARELEHQIQSSAADRTHAERDQREMTAVRDHLKIRIAELTEERDAAKAEFARDTASAKDCSAQLQRVQGGIFDCADEKEQLQNERQQLLETLHDITASERQLLREREITQICACLTEVIPGVHGRVIDLCRPSQKRLHVAVNVAMGKFLDAVIVDSSETARACVRYLKERMLEPLTFLPLSGLRCPQQDPRLQDLVNSHRTLKLGLNCVCFDEKHARAFEFLLGDVVVADSMTDGRRFAFGDSRALGVRSKVVTAAGETIAKNGNLSVNSDATTKGVTRFDLTALDATKTRLEAIDCRLHEIQAFESRGSADVATMRNQAQLAEAKSSQSRIRLKLCEEQLAHKVGELQVVEKQLASLDPEVARLAQEEAELVEERRQFEESLGKMVRSIFSDLSAAMGVPDVRQAERDWRRERDCAQQREDEMKRQLDAVMAELQMVQQTLRERAARSREESVPKLQAEVDALVEQAAETERRRNEFTSELRRCEDHAKACQEAERHSEQVLAKLRQETKEKRQLAMAAEKRLGDLQSEEQVLHDARADILRRSVLEDVEVPLQGERSALQDLTEAPSQAANAPTQRSPVDSSNIAVDFSNLPPNKQAASVGVAAKMLEEEYRSELERLRVELERLNPNLKACDQIHSVSATVQAASHEADLARKEIDEIGTKFEAVRESRKARFMDCFTKVSSEISAVYKRLTANTAGLHSDGGSAYLDLEDTEEPYNAGIKFTAMPPAKRFRDMHLLSGGEKTLAAMALLFAVHAYQKPPFMVLDEVDAALDANNVQSLSRFVEDADCQMIVISLKDKFFVRASALVGVWKDKPNQTSSVLTVDLTAYQPSS